MENKPKTHMPSPLEVRSEQTLFKNGNICSSSCPGANWSFFFFMLEIRFPLFQRKSNYFPAELTWRLFWNASEKSLTEHLFLSPSTKKYLKFYFSESLTVILIHILQLERRPGPNSGKWVQSKLGDLFWGLPVLEWGIGWGGRGGILRAFKGEPMLKFCAWHLYLNVYLRGGPPFF